MPGLWSGRFPQAQCHRVYGYECGWQNLSPSSAPLPVRLQHAVASPFQVRDIRRRRLSINEVATYRDIALTRGHAGKGLRKAKNAFQMGGVEAARLVDVMRQVCHVYSTVVSGTPFGTGIDYNVVRT